MNINDIKIPDDLLKDIKVLGHMLDTYDQIESITMTVDFAELIKPYSKRIADQDYILMSGESQSLYAVKTKIPSDLDLTDPFNDWVDTYNECTKFSDELRKELARQNHHKIFGYNALIWLEDAYYSMNYGYEEENKSITEILQDPTFMRVWCHSQCALKELQNRHSEGFSKNKFLTTLIASTLPEFEKHLWTGNNILTDKYYSDFQLAGSEPWKDYIEYLIKPEAKNECDPDDRLGRCFMFLLQDKILKINIHHEGLIKNDLLPLEILYFNENENFKDFDQPITPEGFLLIKMMEI
ncbi:hypothetical protein SOX05_08610 [Pseudomonas putida]|nr:hypothetical protein [Pseudomonas putida]MDY4319322.1 hypothetical protein [Pseudomonas putida]MDY4352707.1 hypothetical protein [Pseudomonas putida]